MSNTNQNPTDLTTLAQLIAERASAEDLHMSPLGKYARQLKTQPGMTLTQAIILNYAERLGPLADCLVLQTDPQGAPRVVYVVGAETAESICIDLTDEEYQQVLDVFKDSPFPVTWMRLVIAEDGSFGNVKLKTLNPPASDDDQGRTD